MLFRKLFVVCFLLLAASCQQENDYVHLNGFTMGTSYQITLKSGPKNTKELHQAINQELAKINQLMSTYIDDSELSRFNQSKSLKCQPISVETYYVIKHAIELSEQTTGRFDVTIGPLISEWGFDKKQTQDTIPPDNIIIRLLQETGFEKLQLGEQCLQKKIKGISINLSAIAKGYAVDQISTLLKNHGITDFLVEIGGETASQGVNPHSFPWRLAIEAPVEKLRQMQQIFTPLGLGAATSGDYRNYFEKDGIRFSHTIDPTTGKPTTHNLVSVTVLHKKTMLADAYATAFMVMGSKETIAFANKNNIPVYLLVKKDGVFEAVHTKSFEKHLLVR